MEYIDRGSLRPYVGSLSPAQIAGVLEGLLAGLAHAEQHGIVHRDLKPENLMVTDDGRVKIADFGIAKATNQLQTGAFLTATGTTVGTPTYMAPEQAMAQEIGPWTDLYSVGCMAFELYTGRVPFSDSEAPMAILLRHVNEPIPPISTVDPSIDEGLSAWVERLVVKEPKERTQNATEAWDDLEEIIIGLQGPRWRRAARLVDRAPQADTPKPLTPAPFEGTEARQGDFESYVADAPAGPATPPPLDAPAGPLRPGPVDVPVGPPTPPPMEPVIEDDFVTFGAGGPAGPAPAEDAAAKPADEAVAEPAAAVPSPAEEVVAEPAAAVPSPAEEAVAEPAAAEPSPADPAAEVRSPAEEAVAEPAAAEPSPADPAAEVRSPAEEAVAEPATADPEARAGAAPADLEGDAAAEPAAPEPGAWAVPPDVAAAEAADADEPALPTAERPAPPMPTDALRPPPGAPAEDFETYSPPPPLRPPEKEDTRDAQIAPREPTPPATPVPEPDDADLEWDDVTPAPWPARETQDAGSKPAPAAPESREAGRAATPAPESREAGAAATPAPERKRRVTPAAAGAAAGAAHPADLEPTVMPEALKRAPAEPAKRRRSRAFPILLVAAPLLAIVAGLLIGSSGGEDPPESAEPVTPVAAQAGTVKVPAGFGKLSDVPAIPGLELEGAAAAAPGGRDGDRAVAVGLAEADDETLLPDAFQRELGLGEDEIPDRTPVKLGEDGLQAYRYENLKPAGFDRNVTLYAAPTTEGVVTVACLAQPADAKAFKPGCEAIANTLSPAAGDPFPVGPDPAYAKTLGATFGALGDRVTAGRRAINADNTTFRRQASASRRIARGYSAAADKLEGTATSPADKPINTALVARLNAAAAAWRDAAGAARRRDKDGFRAAGEQISKAEAELGRAVARLKAAGYEVQT